MPIVKITTQLRGCQRMTHGGVPFENGMSVEIMDPDLHPKSGKNYFNTSNVKLIANAFVQKYGPKYSILKYDFIREHMIAEIL